MHHFMIQLVASHCCNYNVFLFAYNSTEAKIHHCIYRHVSRGHTPAERGVAMRDYKTCWTLQFMFFSAYENKLQPGINSSILECSTTGSFQYPRTGLPGQCLSAATHGPARSTSPGRRRYILPAAFDVASIFVRTKHASP